MQSYEVTQSDVYIKEIGQKVKKGTVIELREGDANRYLESQPGLLKPVLMKMVYHPTTTLSGGDQSDKVPSESPSEPKASEETSEDAAVAA